LLQLDRAELRKGVLDPREEVAPEGQAAADEVLPHPTLRLVQAEGDPAAERGAVERLIDLVLVAAVAELVHRGKDRLEVVLGIARRQADVGGTGAACERVDGRVESPSVVREAE